MHSYQCGDVWAQRAPCDVHTSHADGIAGLLRQLVVITPGHATFGPADGASLACRSAPPVEEMLSGAALR